MFWIVWGRCETGKQAKGLRFVQRLAKWFFRKAGLEIGIPPGYAASFADLLYNGNFPFGVKYVGLYRKSS